MINVHTLIATGTCRYESHSSPALPSDSVGTVGRSTIELSVKGTLVDAVFRIRLDESPWWSRRPAVLVAEPVHDLPLREAEVAVLAADALALWQWRQTL